MAHTYSRSNSLIRHTDTGQRNIRSSSGRRHRRVLYCCCVCATGLSCCELVNACEQRETRREQDKAAGLALWWPGKWSGQQQQQQQQVVTDVVYGCDDDDDEEEKGAADERTDADDLGWLGPASNNL